MYRYILSLHYHMGNILPVPLPNAGDRPAAWVLWFQRNPHVDQVMVGGNLWTRDQVLFPDHNLHVDEDVLMDMYIARLQDMLPWMRDTNTIMIALFVFVMLLVILFSHI